MRSLLLLLLLAFTITACPLDPAKVPPCTGHETYPDPCAAAPRDAGRE